MSEDPWDTFHLSYVLKYVTKKVKVRKLALANEVLSDRPASLTPHTTLHPLRPSCEEE